jgi:hypothetical protein
MCEWCSGTHIQLEPSNYGKDCMKEPDVSQHISLIGICKLECCKELDHALHMFFLFVQNSENANLAFSMSVPTPKAFLSSLKDSK